jgi:hypothetical protein
MINPNEFIKENNYSIFIGLINNAPLPLAYSFDQFETEIDKGRKLNSRHALFDFCCSIESLIKFLVSIALLEIVNNNKGHLSDNLANDLREKLQSPTFNVWRDVLDKLVNSEKYQPVLLPEIKEIQLNLAKLINASSNELPESNLTKIRNAIAHGNVLGEKRANQYLEFWLKEFNQLLPSLACLQSIELWVGTKKQARKMNGYILDGVEGNPPPEVLHLFSDNKATILFRNVNNQPVPLKMHPINQWSNLPDGGIDYLQLYARFGNIGPLYDLFSNEDGLPLQVEGAPENLEAIKAMLNFKDKQDKKESAKYEVQSQEADVESAARKQGAFVGREQPLNALIDAVSNKQSGIIWLSGSAGMGKSALMGQLYISQLKSIENAVDKSYKKLLFFSFKADSYDCNRSRFMMWLHERIKPQGNNINAPQDPDDILKALPALFQAHDKQCLIMLDGLDELIRREPRFLSIDLERIIQAANDKVLFVIASRDELGIKEKMQLLKAEILFPNGLVGMNAIELRQMLEALCNHNAMRKIIQFDQDNNANNEIKNKVIDIIIEKSKGLPLYLNLLRTDIAVGKIQLASFADLEKTLPKSIEDFFLTVCERQGFSDSHTIPPKIALIIGFIGEPLTSVQIADILSQLIGTDVNESKVSQFLQRLTGILIKSITYDEFQDGYRLLHTDFQDYIKKVDHLKFTRSEFFKSLRSDNLKIFKEPQGEGAKPLYRNAIRILLEIAEGSDEEEKQKIIKEAETLACNTDYQVARLKCLAENGGDAGFVNDWHLLRNNGAGWEGEGLEWSCFWLNEGYKFSRNYGYSGFETFILYIKEWGKRLSSSVKLPPTVLGLDTELSYISSYKTSFCLSTMHWHKDKVLGGCCYLNDYIITWSEKGEVALWTINGQLIKVENIICGYIKNVIELTSGDYLVWSLDSFYIANKSTLVKFKTFKEDNNYLHISKILEVNQKIVISINRKGFAEIEIRTINGEYIETFLMLKNDNYSCPFVNLPSSGLAAWDSRQIYICNDQFKVQKKFSLIGKENIRHVTEFKGNLIVEYDYGISLYKCDGNLLVKLSLLNDREFKVLETGSILYFGENSLGVIKLDEFDELRITKFDNVKGQIYDSIKLSSGAFFTLYYDGEIRLWSKDGQHVTIIDNHRKGAGLINRAFETRLGAVVTWTDHGWIEIWSTEGINNAAYKLHDNVVNVVELPNNRLLSVGEDVNPRILDINKISNNNHKTHVFNPISGGMLNENSYYIISEYIFHRHGGSRQIYLHVVNSKTSNEIIIDQFLQLSNGCLIYSSENNIYMIRGESKEKILTVSSSYFELTKVNQCLFIVKIENKDLILVDIDCKVKTKVYFELHKYISIKSAVYLENGKLLMLGAHLHFEVLCWDIINSKLKNILSGSSDLLPLNSILDNYQSDQELIKVDDENFIFWHSSGIVDFFNIFSGKTSTRKFNYEIDGVVMLNNEFILVYGTYLTLIDSKGTEIYSSTYFNVNGVSKIKLFKNLIIISSQEELYIFKFNSTNDTNFEILKVLTVGNVLEIAINPNQHNFELLSIDPSNIVKKYTFNLESQ